MSQELLKTVLSGLDDSAVDFPFRVSPTEQDIIERGERLPHERGRLPHAHTHLQGRGSRAGGQRVLREARGPQQLRLWRQQGARPPPPLHPIFRDASNPRKSDFPSPSTAIMTPSPSLFIPCVFALR